MSDGCTTTCPICGETIKSTDETITVMVTPPDENGCLYRIVHKECYDSVMFQFY